jgi:hypothetical protein
VTLVNDLMAEPKGVCAGPPDERRTPRHDDDYAMADIGLSAFSIFFTGSPSFLAHQRALAEGHGRSDCETLFAMSAIPSDNYIRLMLLMLDGAAPARVRWAIVQGDRVGRPADANRARSNVDSARHGAVQTAARNFPYFPGATLVAPGHKKVLPLPPEFIVPRDGSEKQDCERNAAKRWAILFQDWDHLLRSTAAAAVRPP